MPILDREFKARAQQAFTGTTEVFATPLVGILLKTYGPEVLNWDGQTIQLEIKDDFEVELPRRVYDRMMALILAMTTNRVFQDVPVFDETVSALAGKGLGYEQDVPAVEDVAWAVTEIVLNDPQPEGRNPSQPWSSNIAKYVRVVLDDEGMPIPPKALDFASKRGVQGQNNEDQSFYASTWQMQQERANEVDEWVENQVGLLLDQLIHLGIAVPRELVQPADTVAG